MDAEAIKIVALEDLSEIAEVQKLLDNLTAEYIKSHADPRRAMALLMCALPLHAGVLAAGMQDLGLITATDARAVPKAAAANCREGLKAGLVRFQRTNMPAGSIN